LSLSSQSDRTPDSKIPRPSMVPRGVYKPQAIPRAARNPHYASMHLPRGTPRGALRVSISAEHRGDPYERSGILVTSELERKTVTADQMTVSSNEVLDHDRREPYTLRTTWHDRPSDDSVDMLKPAAPVLKAFA
jgi:hypothetical protein